MTKTLGKLVTVCTGMALIAATAGAQVVLGPGNQSGNAGDTVDFQFSISGASAAQVAVARFRLALDPATAVITPVLKDATTGEVDCTIASDLASHVTTGPVFYQPAQKRVVIGFGDFAAPVQAFGRDGMILSCKFTINAGTAAGMYPLACSGAPTASDAAGGTIASSCADGQLTVGGGPTPVPTVPSAPVVLGPGIQCGAAGATVDFAFAVTGSAAAQVAVARFRLALDPATAVITPVLKDATTGEVDCTIESDLASHVTTGPVFSQPTQKRVVIGFGDFAAPVQPFGRDGVILTCKFMINAGTANGNYPLACSGAPTASDANGGTLESACADGSLTVGTCGGTPSPTTPVISPTPTNTAVTSPPVTPPTTKPITATPTRTNTPGAVAVGTAFEDEDGCQIGTNASGNVGWLLLVPAVGLLVLRRKRR